MKKSLFTFLALLFFSACNPESATLSGTYKCADCLYEQLEFKENELVEISAGGIKAQGTYEVEENMLTISTETSDYVFEIAEGNVLIGKDEAKGKYVK